ncbi:MAG: ATP-binding cassette domain-containing protein [Gammaproteobacteria bacterium]|nr:ATP-binding cassette domain-containing protein [Gammaproteobacteria bacterium]
MVASDASQFLLRVKNLSVQFKVPQPGFLTKPKWLRAVDDVSFELKPGETLGVVGESGCGKSTLARAVLGLVPTTNGEVTLQGGRLTGLTRKQLRAKRQIAQIIFQDPLASLNPRMPVGEIIAEPLKTFRKSLSKSDRQQAVQKVMQQVGLSPQHINRYPHEFSGGQCQRIGIARALVLQPKLIICDEPVSALDVSIQAQIINLLRDLQREQGIALMFIAHDLSVVRHISDRVMVMYLGRVVEMADKQTLYELPQHPYTQALLKSVPVPDPQQARHIGEHVLDGDVPSPIDPPSGCAFRTRCPQSVDACADQTPLLRNFKQSLAACIRLEHLN